MRSAEQRTTATRHWLNHGTMHVLGLIWAAWLVSPGGSVVRAQHAELQTTLWLPSAATSKAMLAANVLPPAQEPPRCWVVGRVTGKLRGDSNDEGPYDPDRADFAAPPVLTHMAMYTTDQPRRLLHTVAIDANGWYASPPLDPGRRYIVAPYGARWNSSPRSLRVRCPPDSSVTHTVNFRVRGLR